MTETKSMFDILSSMDASVFEGKSDMSEEYLQDYSGSPEDIPVLSHDEFIDKNIAKRLLGSEFDEACDYKLITTYESTCLLKIDPRIPEDAEPVTDSTGKIIGGHMVEIPLTSNDEVLSYGDMMSMISNKDKKVPTDLTYRRNIYEMKSPKSTWLIITGTIFFIMLVAGVSLITLLL